MSIKADRWIRERAERDGMIEPFEAGQVREVDGATIVSYGTSSYGYDVRCSNVISRCSRTSTRPSVDPKRLRRSAASLTSRGTVVCIIPPNSFASSRSTVEYFRIPQQDVLVICLGKVHLRALRHHRQRDPARTRVGRARDIGVFQHHTVACENLRERGCGADAVPRVGRSL